MYPRSFDYFSPKNISEALELLKGYESSVKVLAGGQSLIPALKIRALSLNSVVDITSIKELNYVRQENQLIKIGATTTTGTLEYDPIIASALPILKETASEIADPLIRNLGTVGGDLCYGDPANDFPPVMLALNASVSVASKQGTKKVSLDSFFVDAFKTALKPEEILTGIEIPLQQGRSGSAYHKIRKGSGGFTIAGVAVNLSVDESRAVSGCRIAMSAVGPKVLRAKQAEQALMGNVIIEAALDEAAKLAVEASKPVSDINASAEYRRKALSHLMKESVILAYERAVGVRI